MAEGYLATTVMEPKFVLSFLVAFGAAYYFMNSRKKKYNLPPYPWTRVPLIGNAIQLSTAKKRSFELFYETAKTDKYQKVFMIQIGGVKAVVLNHIDVVWEALLTRHNDFAGRPQLFSTDLMSGNGQDILCADFGQRWKNQRKLAHAALRAYASGKHLETILHSSTSKSIEEMLEENGKPFNVRPAITLLIFNLYAGILFSKEYEIDDPEFNKFMDMTKEMLDLIGSGFPADFFPWMRHFPSGRVSKARRYLDDYMTFLRDRIEEHEKNFDPKNISDLTDFLIQSLKEVKEGEDVEVLDSLSKDYVAYTVFDILGAAIDTMVTTLHFAMGMMAKYPDVRAKCQEEIQEAIGSRLPVISDRGSLPYTEATLYEIMRTGTMAVLGVPLSTTCDTTVGGYELPKGTMVMVNIWGLHHDADHWDEPEVFRPERFLDDSGQLAPKPASFLPFSAGRRVCLGESMAKTQLMVILPTLLQRLTLSPEPGKPLVIEYEDSGLANVPKPFDIVVEARE